MSSSSGFRATARSIAERLVLAPVQFILNNISVNHNILTEIKKRTSIECADYIMKHARSALQFDVREKLWDYSLSKMAADGLILEFGVLKGYSANYFAAKLPQRTIFGFDSFEGLHVDWAGTPNAKGTFDQGGKMPAVRANVTLVKGWFDQTMPGFLAQHAGNVALLHIDCDTYEATKIVLDLVKPRLAVGTVVIFDDYLGYRGWDLGENKAWLEFVQSAGIQYRYLGFTNERMSLIIEKV